MAKNIIDVEKDASLLVSGASKDESGTSAEVVSEKPSIEDDDDSDLEEVVDGFVFDASKENAAERTEALKKLSVDLSHGKESNVAKASSDGLSEEDAVIKDTDILSAYFQSEAFRQRAMKSLGYDSLDGMPPEHREVYDAIVSRGKELSTNLRVALVKPSMRDSIHSYSFSKPGECTVVVLNPNDKFFGMSIFAHELAHHLYQEGYIKPGILKDEESYGTDRSPYNTINKSKINVKKAMVVYEGAFKYMSEFAGLDGKEWARNYVSSYDMFAHDDAGDERAADIHGVRLLMLQEGIWNPFTGEPVTVKQVEEFRKAHPDSRIFEYWSDKEATYYLNNIAMSDKVKPDGVRMGYGDDGECHLMATVGGSTIDKVITQRDYDKLLALDDGKRGVLMSRLLGDEGCTLDLSDGVPLGELLAKEELKPSEERTIDGHTARQREGKDYLAMSAANFESVSRGLDDGEQQHRGMSV